LNGYMRVAPRTCFPPTIDRRFTVHTWGAREAPVLGVVSMVYCASSEGARGSYVPEQDPHVEGLRRLISEKKGEEGPGALECHQSWRALYSSGVRRTSVSSMNPRSTASLAMRG